VSEGLAVLSWAGMKVEIDNLYKCACHPELVEGEGHKLAGGDGLAQKLATMVEGIWKKQGMPKTINKAVVKAFAKELWKGTTEGYGSNFSGIDYGTPDYNMLVNLERSVYAFSGAKNYQQMKAITEALIGDDGKVRTFSEFKDIAQGINSTHLSWLKTEYDTAIASGQMAGKWVDIEAGRESHPFLQYDAVLDDHTSDICEGFADVLLPIDDPFWSEYYPPNHFNCRSTVRQRSGGDVSDSKDIVISDKIPAMFKVNLAKEGLVFPEKSTYFIGAPQLVLKDSIALIPKK
jgi:hypothetical protein